MTCPMWRASVLVSLPQALKYVAKRLRPALASQNCIELGGLGDPRVDFAAKHPKVDRFGKKRLGATIQRLALGLCVAIGGDHDHRDVRSKLFGFRQQFKTAHS